MAAPMTQELKSEDEIETVEALFLADLTVKQRVVYRLLVQSHRALEAMDCEHLTEKGQIELDQQLRLSREMVLTGMAAP